MNAPTEHTIDLIVDEATLVSNAQATTCGARGGPPNVPRAALSGVGAACATACACYACEHRLARRSTHEAPRLPARHGPRRAAARGLPHLRRCVVRRERRLPEHGVLRLRRLLPSRARRVAPTAARRVLQPVAASPCAPRWPRCALRHAPGVARARTRHSPRPAPAAPAALLGFEAPTSPLGARIVTRAPKEAPNVVCVLRGPEPSSAAASGACRCAARRRRRWARTCVTPTRR